MPWAPALLIIFRTTTPMRLCKSAAQHHMHLQLTMKWFDSCPNFSVKSCSAIVCVCAASLANQTFAPYGAGFASVAGCLDAQNTTVIISPCSNASTQTWCAPEEFEICWHVRVNLCGWVGGCVVLGKCGLVSGLQD